MRRASFFYYSMSPKHSMATKKPGRLIECSQHQNKQYFIKESTPKLSKP